MERLINATSPNATPLDGGAPGRKKLPMILPLKRAQPASDDKTPAQKKDGGLIRFVVTLAVLAWLLRSLLFSAFYIPSGSMVPTLYIGDYLFVAKWPYGYSRYSFPLQIPSFEGRIFSHLPKRGDVIVFRHPVENADLIKRVIGLPGDRIEVRGGWLVLNGHPVQRQALGLVQVRVSPNSPCRKLTPMGVSFSRPANGSCAYPGFLETLPGGPSYTVLDQTDKVGDDFPETSVPDGFVFVMGDNRDDSLDSRFQPMEGGVGFLPVENIVGRATVTFWSTDGSSSYWKPWTWFTALRASRIGNGYAGKAE
jgi:signal peptidase I